MNYVERIIKRFGGQSALAELLGKNQSTVQYWAKAGKIPTKWHKLLLELASKQGIDLTSYELSGAGAIEVATPEGINMPKAEWFGELSTSSSAGIPCYVLNDGRRIISRTGATDILTDKKGGGNLESYINVVNLKKYMPSDIEDHMVDFELPGVVNKNVRGIEAETYLEICRAYISALEDPESKLTDRQKEIAIKCAMFLAACSKIGLIALIDEATGYQYAREQDALTFKLKAYLEEEMRPWERTFPIELWIEFGRLTNWKGPLAQRPKYWGKLVMELIYDNLDPDVSEWLKTHAPEPKNGRNYHQWLTSQYGLKKLIEIIWMTIGMAKACMSMRELRERMAMQFGKQAVQLSLFMPIPARPHTSSQGNILITREESD
jgi:hypothetical protein